MASEERRIRWAFLVLTVCVVIAAGGRHGLSAPAISDGLVGYWPMDETGGTIAGDGSGNGNYGTLSTSSVPTWRPYDGKVGGALLFDGNGGYVLDDDAEIYLNGLDALTVSMWVKSAATATDRGFIVFSDPDGTDDRDMRYDAIAASGGGTNLIKAGITSTGGRQQLESSNNTQSTDWQHLAMTWSSADLVRLYINAVQDTPTWVEPAQVGTLTGYTKLIVGKGSKAPWKGLIDDVRVYNHALSRAELVYLMRTDPELAWNPGPHDRALSVPINAKLSWLPGVSAVSHDVYFGTSSPPPLIGNQTQTIYNPGPLQWGRTYYWQINEVNPAHPDSPWAGNIWSFTVGTGTILREVWKNIGGTSVSNLTGHADYPGNPSFRDELKSLEAPVGWADYYGTRIHGYLHPQTSGDYTFWIASDDASELWLSTNDDPANAVKIAEVAGWCEPRDWDNQTGTDNPNQQSMPNVLTAGEKYYIMVLQKEGWGGDNLAVAWQGPDCPTRDVIDGRYLSPSQTVTISVTPAAPNPANLLVHWELDESGGVTASDSSGNGNNGTLCKCSSPTWDTGKMGGALLFHGNGDYVSVANESNFDITNAITVAAWIKVDAFTKLWESIVTKGDSAWRLHRRGNTNSVAFHCTDEYGGVLRADGTSNVNDGRWHHVVGVYDGSNIYVYVDGVADNNSVASGLVKTNDFDVIIGGNAEQPGRSWNGLIDDVAVWNRALSANEIGWLYNNSLSDLAELPPGWFHQDINTTGGAASESDGLWTVIGDGTDIWDVGPPTGPYYDEFHFVYHRLSGDGQIIARVTSMTATDDWAKAGVMIRESLDGGSKHAMMVMTPTSGHAAAFQWRPMTGGYSYSSHGGTMSLPYWVRIVRKGSTFTGYHSPNGTQWTPQGSATITMAEQVCIGPCVTSHAPDQLCTAVFDNVTLVIADTFYVDDNAPNDPGPGDPGVSDPNEDGSLDHPFDAIQEAINAASAGDTVIVLDGTYAGSGNYGISFDGKAITVRSEDGPDRCIIDCQGMDLGFGFWAGEQGDSVLEGLTITNGNAVESGGGAISCSASSPTINNCIIRNNVAYYSGGGGIYCWQSSPVITNCIIRDNVGVFGGGGLYCDNNSTPKIRDCTFRDNNPDGVHLDLTSGAWIIGTVQIISDSLTGSGVCDVRSGAILDMNNAQVSCNMVGLGTVQVPVGKELVIEGDASIALGDTNYPNVGGIQCDGLLRVKDDAEINNTNINLALASFEGNAVISDNVITTQAGMPYGQLLAKEAAVIVDNDIRANGDRYIDLDPYVFAGVIADNRIFVTITEGRNNTPPGLFELRGKDLFCYEPPCEPGIFQLETVPDFNLTTWTYERLELAADAKAHLTNRFDYQLGEDSAREQEVLYVKQLVLGPNSILNIGLNRLYYEHLEGDPNAIIEKPPQGFSLDRLTINSEREFRSRVTHNNVLGPYPRIHVKRVEGKQPDPFGMTQISNWLDLDPCSATYQQVINGRAKHLLGKCSEGKILLKFEYLFDTPDPRDELVDYPRPELVVYLSDVNGLLAHNHPGRVYHYKEVARIPAPRAGRPGSAGSGRFGVFEKTVSPDFLDFVNGMWLEVELIGPAGGGVESTELAGRRISDFSDDSQLSKQRTAGRLELLEPEQGGVAVFVNNLSVEIHCSGICMDADGNTWVVEEDFLMVIAACGLPATLLPGGMDSLACLDGVLSGNGFVDPLDVVSWDWAWNDSDRFSYLNLCWTPLTESVGTGGNLSGSGRPSLLEDSSGSLSDLLIVGKKSMGSAPSALKLEDGLYAFDSNGVYAASSAPTSDRCNIRLVRGFGAELYQINSETGVRRLGDSNEIIIPTDGVVGCPNEPRYNKPATVYIGIQGTGKDSVGRPILDAAFDADFVYVVPVIVSPNDPCAQSYAAAAKLQLLSGAGTPYQLVQLYDDPPPAADREYRNALREIELDGSGNVYVVNANRINENDILWKYDPNGTVLKTVYLDTVISDGSDPCDPIGLHVSNTTSMVYLASAQYNPNDVNSTLIYGFSNDNLALTRTIRVEGMQHVTSITEEPATGCLWVVGFSMKGIPQWPDPTQAPFYEPYLAKIAYDSNSVTAVSISSPGSHDLALPMSIVWSRTAKCGGADIDGDGKVMFKDFAVFALAWLAQLGETQWNSDCNISIPADNIIDNRDLAILIKHWLDECL